MKVSTPLLVLLLASLLLPTTAQGDEIWMKSGRKLDGVLTDLGNGKVRIEMSFGTIELPADQIERVERGATVAQEVDQIVATLEPNDAETRFELALWCQEQGEATLERRLLEQVIRIDPDHEGARHLLGYLRLEDGTWVTEEQLRQLRGEVRFRGQWVASQEKTRTLQAEQQQAALRRLQALEDARLQVEIARLQLEASRGEEPVAGIPLTAVPIYGGVPVYGGTVPHYPAGYPASGASAQGSSNATGSDGRRRPARGRNTARSTNRTRSTGRAGNRTGQHTRGSRVLYAPSSQAPPPTP